MKKIWIFLLMLPLFCIGDTEIDMINSSPILAQNPEYSAPRAVKPVTAEPAITHEQDSKADPAVIYEPDSRPAAAARAPSNTPQAVSEKNEAAGKRQVYRRKDSSVGIKSLSDDQISDRTFFDPSAENARNRRPVSAGIRTSDNSDELARWKESQKDPARKFIPSDIFRPYSLFKAAFFSLDIPVAAVVAVVPEAILYYQHSSVLKYQLRSEWNFYSIDPVHGARYSLNRHNAAGRRIACFTVCRTAQRCQHNCE